MSLQGRLDTDASAKFELEFNNISKGNPHESLVIDASELEYIASSGLRIVLKMAKTEKNFRLENVNQTHCSAPTLPSLKPLLTRLMKDMVPSGTTSQNVLELLQK